jgi:hypothetical protein
MHRQRRVANDCPLPLRGCGSPPREPGASGPSPKAFGVQPSARAALQVTAYSRASRGAHPLHAPPVRRLSRACPPSSWHAEGYRARRIAVCAAGPSRAARHRPVPQLETRDQGTRRLRRCAPRLASSWLRSILALQRRGSWPSWTRIRGWRRCNLSGRRTTAALLSSAVAACAAAAYFIWRDQPRAIHSRATGGETLLQSPGHGARAKVPDGPAVVLTPLFDRKARFKPGETVPLRFRALNGDSGSPVTSATISASISRTPGDEEIHLTAREVGGGIYEVPFTPGDTGPFQLVVTSGSGAAGPLASVSLQAGGTSGGAGPAGAEQSGSDAEQTDQEEHRLRRFVAARRRGHR